MIKALIGNGGHAREVMAQMGETLPRFVDDEYYVNDENTFPLSKLDPSVYQIMIAVGECVDRLNIERRLPREITFFSYIHPTSLIMGDVEIGEGSFIGAYSVLTTNIRIGKHAILNRAVHVSHDCRIGDFFTGSPGSKISGNCNIGSCVYLGTNSSIREKISVESFVTIGLNSGVVKSIHEPGIYAGVPVKKIR